MKCVIVGGHSVKVFGKAVQCMSKIGDELYIEPLDHGLSVRTVNGTRSAYACFMFSPDFFSHYDDGATERSDDDPDAFRCKLAMKSCLAVFKSLSSMDKTVESCTISLELDEDRLVFQLFCRHGVTKTYSLTYQESERLEAMFSKDMSHNRLVTQAKLLSETVVNFHTSQEEVTFIATPEKLCLKNYIDDEPDPNKVVHTELMLSPTEFDDYTIGLDTEVTFCLKELRAILLFADPGNLVIGIHFETIGKPIVFSLETDPTYKADFVLATLSDPSSASQLLSQNQGKENQDANIGADGDGACNGPRKKKLKPNNKENGNTLPHTIREEFFETEETFKQMNFSNNTSQSYQGHNEPSQSQEYSQQTGGGSSRSQFNLTKRQFDRAQAAGTSTCRMQQTDLSAIPSTSRGLAPSLLQSLEHPSLAGYGGRESQSQMTAAQDWRMSSDDEEQDEEDCIPGTPPTQKMKSLFFAPSQSTLERTRANPVVLVEDTDEEGSDSN